MKSYRQISTLSKQHEMLNKDEHRFIKKNKRQLLLKYETTNKNKNKNKTANIQKLL